MPTATQVFRALITVDSDGAVKELRKFDQQVDKTSTGTVKKSDKVKSSFTGIAVSAKAVGAGVVLGFGKKSIDAASNLEESINAVRVVFGGAADDVLAIGESSAQSFGLSQASFNQFATQFSAFAKQIAQSSGRSVVDVVQEMTTRVADFASVHNLSLEEAARVTQSTLAGETEAFRRYGGDVSAATIKTYAYENGIADVGKELTEGQKVLARYGAFMEQTSSVAGDFANTSDSLANKQRILNARLEDQAAKIGARLIPAAEGYLTVLGDILTLAEKGSGGDPEKGFFGGLSSILLEGPLIKGYNALRDAITGVGDASEDSADSFVDFEYHISNLSGAIVDTDKALGKYTESAAQQRAEARRQTVENDKQTVSTDRAAEAVRDATRANQRYIAELDRAIEAQVRKIEKDREARDSARRLADQTYGLLDAQDDLADSVDRATATLADEDATAREVQRSVRDVARSADAVATKQVEMAGATLDSRKGLQIWNESMLASAGTMDGRLRRAIAGHISRVNDIPGRKSTSIEARLDRGAIGQVENELNYVARNRSMTIRAYLEFIGAFPGSAAPGVGQRANGGTVREPLTLVGERGPELVSLPNGSRVHTNAESRRMMAGAGSGGGNVINLTVNAGMGVNGQEVGRTIVDEIRKFERSNGTSWRAA